jgi:hypothetical protein
MAKGSMPTGRASDELLGAVGKSCNGERRTKMASKQWLTGAAGALALAVVTGAAQSAPLGSVATDVRADATNQVERAQYRICAMEGGVRRCRRVEIYGYQPPSGGVYGYQPTAPVYGYAPLGPGADGNPGIPQQYGYEFPDQYPVGSGAWWESMRQTGRDGSSGGGQ